MFTASIKYLGDFNNNYNRFGKIIPKTEEVIDVAVYFNCDEGREKFIIDKLLTDKNVFFKLHKPAGETIRKEVAKFEKAAEAVKVEEDRKEIEKAATETKKKGRGLKA